MPSSTRPRSLIISSTSSVPTESRTRFFRAKEISYTSFLSNLQKVKTEMTSFSDVNINTIGFSHDRIRRTPRTSRYSLAVPDTVSIPPSQLVAYIEANLLYVVHVKNEKIKENTHVVITDIRLKESTKVLLVTVPYQRTIYYRKPLLRKFFFAIL